MDDTYIPTVEKAMIRFNAGNSASDDDDASNLILFIKRHATV